MTGPPGTPAGGQTGPLAGIRVIELLGIGPGPFCGMLLADLGAEVIRIERPAPPRDEGRTVPADVLGRGRRSLALDLKVPAAAEIVLALAATADALIEGFRPGVAERLGVGPDECLRRNPRLVYGRMTGWGQDGPNRDRAGHDINYIALAGALGQLGPPDGPPPVPLNLVGDFGGGGLLLALGVVSALLPARATGQGQVVDAAIVDGTATLLAMMHALVAAGRWQDRPGVNFLDGTAPYYTTYQCADGRYVAVGALEDKFYAQLLDGLGLSGDPACRDDRTDPRSWPALRARLAAAFAGRSQPAWSEVFEGTDACVTPVLTMGEAAAHPHLAARGTYPSSAGVAQPAPAPRFSVTGADLPPPAPAPGRDSRAILAEAGLRQADIDDLIRAGAVAALDPVPTPDQRHR
jgi:alpha-methylacyl-CoA racemase